MLVTIGTKKVKKSKKSFLCLVEGNISSEAIMP